jgi:hypothetical protein
MPRLVAFAAALAALLLTAAPTFAQHDATWKALGQKGPSHQGFSRRIQHAADYSRDLHAYVHPPAGQPLLLSRMLSPNWAATWKPPESTWPT